MLIHVKLMGIFRAHASSVGCIGLILPVQIEEGKAKEFGGWGTETYRNYFHKYVDV